MRQKVTYLVLAGALSVLILVGGSAMPRPAAAAPAIGSLVFSTDMTPDFAPAGVVGVEFPGENDGVFVTFTYTDLPPGSTLGRIVRFGTEDFNFDDRPYGTLSCCPNGGSGRYGFRVLRINGEPGDLPGGAYSVLIYLNGQEAQSGGFGIRGEGGGDDELPGGDEEDDDDDDDDE